MKKILTAAAAPMLQTDEGLDDGMGGIGGGQLGQVRGMLEVKHDGSPVWLGQKKTRRGRTVGALRD